MRFLKYKFYNKLLNGVYIYCSLLQSKRSIGFFLISRAKIRSFSLFNNKKFKKKKKKNE